MRHLAKFLGGLFLLLVSSISSQAQTVSERHRSTAPLSEASSKPWATQTAADDVRHQAKADPVANGVGYGALIGAATGVTFVAVSYAQCDSNCDGPELYPVLLAGAGIGAGIGAAVGWIVDGLRRSDHRLRVAVEPTPKRKL